MLVEHSTKQAIPLALLNFSRKNKLGSTQSESKENSENGQHVGAETSGVPISSAHCTLLDYLGCNQLAVKGKYKLTYNLDDLGQEHAISHILLEVLDEAFVARFGEVMIGPIGVDLQNKKHTGNFRNLGRAHDRVRGNCGDPCLGATVTALLVLAAGKLRSRQSH